jgi:spoIIIJ-associated protein
MATNNPSSVETTGKTVDDAVQQALRRLNRSRNQVDVRVLSEGRPGVFGIGASEARVRVSVLGAGPAAGDPDEAPLPKIDDYADYAEVERRPAGPGRGRGGSGGPPGARRRDPSLGPPAARTPQDRPSRDRPSRSGPPPRRDAGRERGRDRDRDRYGGRGRGRGDRDPIMRPDPLPFALIADPEFEPEDDQDPTAFAAAVLTDLLHLMRLEAVVTPRSPETPMDGLNHAVAVLDVSPPDATPDDGDGGLGALIGRQGEHLAALQYMVNLIVSRALEGRHAFTVDVGGYKRRREQELIALAADAAAEARETGVLVELEPMPPAERRIVHLTLSEQEGIETESSGVGAARRVQIVYRGE